MRIGAVGLAVRDLDRLVAYYRDLLRLTVLGRTADTARLGVDGVTLLALTQAKDALADDTHEAGLYHTAFLMPTRADLARWIVHAANARVPITGASDHDVSEAIYLDDPEGNGVEVYADRPRERWKIDGATIFQKTEYLDIDDIVAAVAPADAGYPSAPAGLRVGHIHLRVGDIARAESFYVDALGFAVTRRRGGATFVSTGGYHHHIAVNTWHSAGAGVRAGRRAGLDWFAVEVESAAELEKVRARLAAAGVAFDERADGFAVSDPWGTTMHIAAAGWARARSPVFDLI
jgi:catechol 2,3-dioxygenase